MSTTVDEIAPDIFRIATLLDQRSVTFIQFLIRDEMPLLYHTGARALFPDTLDALKRLIDPARLRYVSWSHLESDECGAVNDLLAVAPNAELVQGEIGVSHSVSDFFGRPVTGMADGGVLDLGEKRLRFLLTPNVPHCWDAIALFEETTSTLFAGDLFTHVGDTVAITDDDIVGPAMDAEAIFRATSLAPDTVVTLERLAALSPATLAVMHGASYRGDGARALKELAAAQAELEARSAEVAAAERSMRDRTITIKGLEQEVKRLGGKSKADQFAPVDDLREIPGIGAATAKSLKTAGFTAFHHIAALTEEEIEELSKTLRVSSEKIARDKWVQEAKKLHYSKYKERI